MKMGVPELLKNQVRKIRKEHHLTLVGLEQISGVPASTIGDIERGAEPLLRTAVRIADALNTPIFYLWPELFKKYLK